MILETYKYKQNGCVGASTRRLLELQGYEFATFAEGFEQYQLEIGNEENIHMLGVPIVLANAGVGTFLHTVVDIEEYQLPQNASPKAFELQPKIVREINRLKSQSSLSYEAGYFDTEKFRNILIDLVGREYLGLVFVDWDKWATTPERLLGYKKYNNPRHVICIQGITDETVDVYDPAIDNSNQAVTIPDLWNALNEKQQLIFIEKKVHEV